MLATDKNGKTWLVGDGILEPIGHDTDPDSLTRAEEDYLFDQVPAAPVVEAEDPFGFRYDVARDRYKEVRL